MSRVCGAGGSVSFLFLGFYLRGFISKKKLTDKVGGCRSLPGITEAPRSQLRSVNWREI